MMTQEASPWNIRVNALRPGGLVATPAVLEAYGDKLLEGTLQPGIIREPAVYLASDESVGVTGESIAATAWATDRGKIRDLFKGRPI